RIPLRRVSMTGSPPVISRAAWGANEAIRRAAPSYARTIQFAVVHHTAGSNSYTAAQSPAIVRGIEVYHVKGNGWNDIGYNFLIDKYGQVFEGRYGGVDKNVIGAHAEGFNTGSVGIALMGTYQTTAPTAAEKTALVNLLSWRLDVAHVDPLSTLTYASGGNARFPSGTPVFLRAVSGHRLHHVPGRRALHAARRARASGRDDGTAQAVRAERAGAAWRAGPLPGAAQHIAAVDGDRFRLDRGGRRSGNGDEQRDRLDVG